MSYFDDRGDLGPPPEPFRFGRGGGGGGGSELRSPVPLRWIGVAAALLLLYIVLNVLKSIYVDLMWFDSVDYGSVYHTVILWKVVLFLAGAAISAAVIGGNILIARRFAPRGFEESFIEEVDVDSIRRVVAVLLVTATLFMAVIFGTVAGGSWETLLSWLNSVDFGREDPQFGRDLSFYVFSLPAYGVIQSWLLGLTIVSALAAGAVYGLALSLQRFEWRITRAMRIHLSILAGIALLLIAVQSYLGIFDLVNSPGGIVYGGAYADLHARLPAQYVIAGLAAATGLVVIANAFLSPDSYRLPIFIAGLWLLSTFVGGVIYPSFVQQFQVDPNELQRERPYIARNIELTRFAFGLGDIEERSYPANPSVSEEEIAENPETIDNIRLLDPIPLRSTFNQIQALRRFYQFWDIDVDRYTIDGDMQQVMASARELDINRAEDRNWTRDRLQLTHGFGAVVSPVNEVGPEGLPRLITADIPPVSESIPLTIEGSRIYFGELTDQYIVGNSQEPEFDYPLGDGNESTSYPYDRGIQLNSFLRRFALAWDLGDQNLLISGQINDNSRLLMNRNIQDRIREVAPFLRLDSDPYVVIHEGELMWIQPAYTVASNVPYSQPQGGINYIRHSVTVTVDAQTGDMTFYLIDPSDPVAATWSNIFPDLFTPRDEMPQEIFEHLRYPLDMFAVQSVQYLRYHITEADAFFTAEDVWNIPTERFQNDEQPVEPYYVVMRLPRGGDTEAVLDQVEFVLIMPFTPAGERKNTVAWLAGRSDGENFGTLRAYRFPTDTTVFGPAQIEARIDQDPLISQQLSLWDRGGSEVIRGNLLMIPVGSSFLYVEPIYLQAQSSSLPELARVVVANGNEIAMEPTLQRSLDVLAGRRAPTQPGALEDTPGTEVPNPPTPTPTPAGPTPTPTETATPSIPLGTLEELLQQANDAADASQAELDRLRQVLEALQAELERQQAP
ncbi:MAG: UPF0182 family protein [Dehalococcoidia bacterium]|nr:UPF0182 family protein [Dehalococcoidia bacterium]MCB9482819.1 UPF0182 family protein [Dehalococcoidia bacterium]MCB9492134.1 UPF0182 family protein [Dehalococcoidia bacterium]